MCCGGNCSCYAACCCLSVFTGLLLHHLLLVHADVGAAWCGIGRKDLFQELDSWQWNPDWLLVQVCLHFQQMLLGMT